jgi:hypothetical protein
MSIYDDKANSLQTKRNTYTFGPAEGEYGATSFQQKFKGLLLRIKYKFCY